jgi:energy-coupling factor transporter ATP-binding protein EcfA2
MSLLLGNEKPSIGIPIENTLEFYIDRTLQCVKYVKTGIQNESEVLVPCRGESLEELQGIGAYKVDKCNIGDYEQGIPQLLLANENDKESRTLCNETKNLQGLCTEEETRLWRHKTDDFGNAYRHLERETTTVWQPTSLLESDGRIILVIDKRGMGKSTLLSHLAKKTRERHPDMWILRVNIKNYTNILHEIQTNGFDENGALKLLTQAAQIKETDGEQLEKQLFNYVYNCTGNMVVMIDGVDKVSPHYTEEVIQILRILFKTKIRKFWVTSRNSVKDQLEQQFQCQSYSLTPFSLEKKKLFLAHFWNQKNPNTKRRIHRKFSKESS